MNTSMFKPSEELVHIFDDATRPGIGKSVRTYVIHELVGTGGMGEVYRVSRSHKGDQVALKIIPFFSRLPKADRDRIEFEQAALETLTHEILGQGNQLNGVFSSNIVQFHEVGRIPDRDLYYIAMEMIHGTSLKEWIPKVYRQGKPNIELIHQILSALLRGLHLVHNKNIVHRDLKPSNILIPYEDGKPRFDQLKLTDFGISFNLSNDERHTIQGMTIGTPDYMSPEQCKGEVVSTASDLYSIGIMLYEMLTGDPPFTSERAMDTMQGHVKTEVIPPSQKLSQNGSSPIPRRLEMICLKCLQKDPKQRYRSASDLLHDLASFYKEYQKESGEHFLHRFKNYTHILQVFFLQKKILFGLLAILGLSLITFGLKNISWSNQAQSAGFLSTQVIGIDNTIVKKISPQSPYVVDVDAGILDAKQPLLSFSYDKDVLLERIVIGFQSPALKSGASMAVADTLYLADESGNQRILTPKFDRGVQFLALSEPLLGKDFKLYFKTKEKRSYHKIAVLRFLTMGIELPKELLLDEP